MPSEHVARHVCAPAGPAHVVPVTHVNAPDANKGPSQLPVGATVPVVVIVKAPDAADEYPSTTRKYRPAAMFVSGIVDASLHAISGCWQLAGSSACAES